MHEIWPAPMSRLFFAFCGPVLWAVSVHLDKYLVERYYRRFRPHGVRGRVWTIAAASVVVSRPNVVAVNVIDACADAASGALYMGALSFHLQALQGEASSVAVADEFWTATFWSFVGQAGFGLVVSAPTRKQLGSIIGSGVGWMLGISCINELVNLAGNARHTLWAAVGAAQPGSGG
jgi:hypothetical protein